MTLSREQFEALTRPLLGLPVSLPWKGYGSAVFFELGGLAPLVNSQRRHHNAGQACIAIEWDWRVEAKGCVLYGSSNSRPEMEAGIQSLKGETLVSMGVAGEVPELVVGFSNGHVLKSMVQVTGEPQWSIRTLDERWIFGHGGKLHLEDSALETSRFEEASFAAAERASIRWGTPEWAPVAGRCASCSAFVWLDGDGHLLDYGCCISESSPYDGKVVHKSSGCPAFLSKDPA